MHICNIAELPNISPMVIGIWCGISKPNLNEYIGLLVSELESILSTGIFVKNHHVTVKFGRVVCDTPARCLMKGVEIILFYLNIVVKAEMKCNALII